jgi:hypothetical protein
MHNLHRPITTPGACGGTQVDGVMRIVAQRHRSPVLEWPHGALARDLWRASSTANHRQRLTTLLLPYRTDSRPKAPYV